MIKVVMCDDDKHLIKHYQALFGKISKQCEIECHYYYNAEDLLEEQLLVSSMNILFLDNYMNGLNGIQTAKIIRKHNKHAQIVFLSSSPDFVFDSFDVSATNYLLKNEITDEIFILKFLKIYEKVLQTVEKKTFTCKEYSMQTILDISDIIAFEVVARKTQVYTVNGVFQCYESIKNIQDQLNIEDFYLINRSCLVHMKYIKYIDKTEVHMNNQLTFQIAVKKASDFKRYLGNYLVNRCQLS